MVLHVNCNRSQIDQDWPSESFSIRQESEWQPGNSEIWLLSDAALSLPAHFSETISIFYLSHKLRRRDVAGDNSSGTNHGVFGGESVGTWHNEATILRCQFPSSVSVLITFPRNNSASPTWKSKLQSEIVNNIGIHQLSGNAGCGSKEAVILVLLRRDDLLFRKERWVVLLMCEEWSYDHSVILGKSTGKVMIQHPVALAQAAVGLSKPMAK